MTLCKVLLYGLKPCDINCSSNDKISEIPLERQRQHSLLTTSSTHHVGTNSSSQLDYLNLHIKPIATPMNTVRNNNLFFIRNKTEKFLFQRSSLSSDTGHESSPIRVVIRETSRGRHRICVSQTLLRTHNSDI